MRCLICIWIPTLANVRKLGFADRWFRVDGKSGPDTKARKWLNVHNEAVVDLTGTAPQSRCNLGSYGSVSALDIWRGEFPGWDLFVLLMGSVSNDSLTDLISWNGEKIYPCTLITTYRQLTILIVTLCMFGSGIIADVLRRRYFMSWTISMMIYICPDNFSLWSKLRNRMV